ncbi:MAG: S8 family peptidase [Elusimicrobiota bacterium]
MLLGSCLAFAGAANAVQIEYYDGAKGFAPAGEPAPPLEVAAGQAFVRFADGTSAADKESRVSSLSAKITGETGGGVWTLVELPAGMRVKQGVEALAALPGVITAQPNLIFRLNRLPSDPLALSQYHLNKTNAFAAWEYDTGGSNEVTIVVIDAGVDFTHPDLAAKRVVGASRACFNNLACAAEAPDTGNVACNHGTRVAGVAAASGDNGQFGAGLSWGAKVISVRIFDTAACNDDCGPGTCVTTESDVVRAIDYATTLQGVGGIGKVVINMSIGGPCECGSTIKLVDSANCAGANGAITTSIFNAQAAGVVLIAAAGNYPGSTNGGPVQAPGNCEHVIPVGATDESDSVAGFSARGSSLAAHGVVAPGVNVQTTDIGGGMAAANGTSFSAPIVAGVAALILSANPTISTTSLKAAMRNSADGIGVSSLGLAHGASGTTAGAGRINAFKAMRLALGKTTFEGDERAIGFPNPFRPTTHGTATLTIPSGLQGKNPKIRLYTMDGKLVRDMGANTTWDGRNDSGLDVATGVYLFLVETDKGQERGRIAVIR